MASRKIARDIFINVLWYFYNNKCCRIYVTAGSERLNAVSLPNPHSISKFCNQTGGRVEA
jgi:hypothetical protein